MIREKQMAMCKEDTGHFSAVAVMSFAAITAVWQFGSPPQSDSRVSFCVGRDESVSHALLWRLWRNPVASFTYVVLSSK